MPTLVTRFKELFNNQPDPTVNNQPDPEAAALSINPMPRRSMAQIKSSVRKHRQSPYVALSLEMVSDYALSSEPGIFTTIDGQELEVIDHPFIDLLNNPNREDTYYDLMGKLLQSVRAFGNCYWLLIGDDNGMPAAIWHLPTARMRIEPSETVRAARYIYEYQGEIIEYNSIEIVHFKRVDLDDDFYGAGMLEAIENDVVLDIKMSEYQLDFFANNNASPSFLLGLPQWGMKKIEEFMTKFLEKFGGGKRGVHFYEMDSEGQNAVLTKTGSTQQEMEFNASRVANKDIIIDRMGVPQSVLYKNVTEASARVGERALGRTAYFDLRRVASRINKDVIHVFYGPDQNLKFEDLRGLDAEQLVRRNEASKDVLTINERRKEFWGYEPLDEKEVTDNASTE